MQDRGDAYGMIILSELANMTSTELSTEMAVIRKGWSVDLPHKHLSDVYDDVVKGKKTRQRGAAYVMACIMSWLALYTEDDQSDVIKELHDAIRDTAYEIDSLFEMVLERTVDYETACILRRNRCISASIENAKRNMAIFSHDEEKMAKLRLQLGVLQDGIEPINLKR